MVWQTVNSERISLEIYNSARGEDTQPPLTKRRLTPFLARLEHFLWSRQLIISTSRVQQCGITIHLCGEYKIRQLNHLYRQKNRTTDVLSFPVHEDLRAGKSQEEILMPELLLGDIFICRQVAGRQADSFGISYFRELIHLIAHGVIHLVGYDHERSEEEDAQSRSLEDTLLWKSR